MKSLRIGSSLIAITLVAGCSGRSVSSALGSGGPQQQSAGKFPAFSETAPTGQVFGASWTALKAGSHKDPATGNVSVQLVAENVDACSMLASRAPIATVVLPDTKEGVEHITDAAVNQFDAPVVFINPSASPIENLMTDLSKAIVSSVSPTGFSLAIYGHATEASGHVSEINGKIKVVNCDTQLDFSVWKKLAGSYRLTKFDGNPPASDLETGFIEVVTNEIRNSSGAYVAEVSFPLYTSVSTSSSTALRFGPLETLGVSAKGQVDGDTVLTYDYSGPIKYRGTDYTLNLHLEVREHVVNQKTELWVKYTAEVPGTIKSTSHSFALAPW